jgi:hypothetical protein
VLNLSITKRLLITTTWTVGVLGMAIAPAAAGITIYEGKSLGTMVGDPTPNADAAAQQFDRAAATPGNLHLIDFEGLSQGPFQSRLVAPRVTVAFGGNVETFYGIQPSWPGVAAGYNTTPGGKQYLAMDPFGGNPSASAYIDFAFSDPIVAFGKLMSI